MDYDKLQLSPTNIKGSVNPIKPSQQIICQPSFINSNPILFMVQPLINHGSNLLISD